MRHQVIRASLASSLMIGTAITFSTPSWAQQPTPPKTAQSRDSQSASVEFNIPAQPLGSAVIVFAEQAGIEVFFDSSKLSGLQSSALKGRYSPRQALPLLLGNLPVGYIFVNDKRVSLERLAIGSSAIELGATHIKGERKDDWIYETPRSISVISREQIDRHPPRHAADMLQDTAGVYTSTSYQEPGLSVNIRGVQDYGRVNMSIDGARQNFQQSGHQQRNGEVFVDPELLGGIDISKGPNSGMGGAGVIGGTANFRTLDINDIVDADRTEGGRLRGSTGLGGYANGNHFAGSFAAGLRASKQIDLLAAFSRKRMGEYSPGSRGDSFPGASTYNADERYQDVVSLTNQDMDSQLFKVYWHMADGHELKFTHLATEVDYTSGGTYDAVRNADGWEAVTRNEVTSKTTSLDYAWNEGDPWIDLAAKLYFTRTRNHQAADAVAPDYSSLITPVATFCRSNPSSSICPQGSDAYTLITETRTWGLNLQNTAHFNLPLFEASWNYGSELSYDKTVPKTQGVENVDTYGNETAGTTPPGQRWLTSFFSNLTLQHDDWLRLDAGLRYDRYRLWGDTGFTTLDSRGEITGVANTRVPVEYSVDDQQGHLSPTFAVAITPVEGVQLYANYGEGWRPPAITESLISGQHLGGANDGTIMLPNPYLKAEESKTWETGVNLKFDNLISSGDSFRAKLAYFNTKIENYIRLANVGRPGAAFHSISHFAPVNMLDPVRLRGFELEAEYDAGAWYLKGNATRVDYHTGQNSYRLFYLGGAQGATADYWNNFISSDGSGQGYPFYSMFPPRDTASLTGGLRFFDRRLELGSRLRYASENESNSITQGSLAYSVVDLFGSLRATDNLTLRLSVENVRDRRYLVPMGDLLARTEGPGRTVIGSFELKF
ncbi:TonB-dependent hemoglobin/transferrin/lactoferrin family receptor [Pseudomonas sp. NPDC089734]|uniref:TonB-dependent receptor n=1 Tax=Pseudomonas sp. NPDC089734 TaxID=3364469 RepID=UPI0038240C33